VEFGVSRTRFAPHTRLDVKLNPGELLAAWRI
jgi:hypothetical protein